MAGHASGYGWWSATALAIGVILGVYAWILAPQFARPFVYDDVNFALAARAIAQTGLPYGNQGYLLHLYEQREQWALWHPPLYLYTLGLAFALFGISEVVGRGVGVACQLITAGFAFDIARRLTPSASARAGRHAAGVLAVALFLLNPLTVQSALVLDIDNTILMLLVTGYVWVALRRPGRWGWGTIAGLASLYAVTLWAKLTTPLLLLAALVFTRLFQRPARGALDALAVGALGWGLFLLSWFAVTHLSGMPADYTFEVAYREALDSQAGTRHRLTSWMAFIAGAAPAILWLGPFFCLLFVAAGLPRLWGLLRGRGLAPTDLVPVLGAAIYLVYMMKLAGGFPKYHASMVALWAAAGAALVARSAGRPDRRQTAVGLAGSIVAVGWFLTYAPSLWDVRLTSPLLRMLIGVPGLLGLLVAVGWARLGRVELIRALPIALALLSVTWSLALDVHQRDLDGSTTYYYGRNGQTDAARALDERLRADELYIAAKEVAWYSQHERYVDQESWQHVVWDLGHGFDGTWLGQDVRLVVLEVADRSWRAAHERALVPRYRAVGEYGNFLLWERASPE